MVVNRLDIVLMVVSVVQRMVSLVIGMVHYVMMLVLVVLDNRLGMLDSDRADRRLDVALVTGVVVLGGDRDFVIEDWLVLLVLDVLRLVIVPAGMLVEVTMDHFVVRHDLMILAVQRGLVDIVLMVVHRLDVVLVIVVVVKGVVRLVVTVMDNVIVVTDDLLVVGALMAGDQTLMVRQLWQRALDMFWAYVHWSRVVQDGCLVGMLDALDSCRVVLFDLGLLMQMKLLLVWLHIFLGVHLWSGVVCQWQMLNLVVRGRRHGQKFAADAVGVLRVMRDVGLMHEVCIVIEMVPRVQQAVESWLAF